MKGKAKTVFIFISIPVAGREVVPQLKIMQKGPELFCITDMNGMNMHGYKSQRSLDAFFSNGKTK